MSVAASRSALAPDLELLADLARAGGRLGIDTEFVSEGRYLPLLCLVQIAVPDPSAVSGVRVELLDPMAASAPDPQPLAAVLADASIEVVMHAGRQDVAILSREWRTSVRCLFDTQVGAAFAGLGAQLGLTALVGALLDRRAARSASFTRWDARPLDEEQLAYARDDVVHLIALADALHERLDGSGRLEWAREECRRLEHSSDERNPETAYRRLPRVARLNGRQRAVARELAAWRERTAAAENRPLGSVLGDAQLVELASRQPTTTDQLRQTRGLHPPTLRRRGDALLEAIARGLAAPPLAREDDERPPPSAGLAPLISLSEALVRARVAEAAIAYELVATRADLQAIAQCSRSGAPEPSVRTLTGWRRELVGAELLELLAGHRSLSIERGALRVRDV
ncbi:MAG: ribonuclease D [Solirubrobacteraceae bacterium]